MKCMSYLWKKFLMEFNLFMQINFVKELETRFWGFVQKFIEEMIIWKHIYINDIYSPVNYIMCIVMVQNPRNGLRHLSLMFLPFIRRLVLRLRCFA